MQHLQSLSLPWISSHRLLPDLPQPVSVTELRFKNFFSVPGKIFSNKNNVIDKVVWLTKSLFVFLLKACLFISNPNLVVMGITAGITWPDTSLTLDRIHLVWAKQHGFVLTAVTIGACFLVLPTIVSVVSFLWAAELGNQAYQEAQG